ncbi:hypothetical protein HPP92_013512 [Vanilla planifolia]|uniref:J domain-containing protein n=1 Tax=Vanilla planifolia TaxID=51239 RepID=A0A835QT83_VANPL|nr:hypothetical protein HPP92_013512 [Vanilla planifolia]
MMARKGNQKRNGVDRESHGQQKAVPESLDACYMEKKESSDEKMADFGRSDSDLQFRSSNPFSEHANYVDNKGNCRSSKPRVSEVPLRRKLGNKMQRSAQAYFSSEVVNGAENDLLCGASRITETDGALNCKLNLNGRSYGDSSVRSTAAHAGSFDALYGWSFQFALHVLEIASEWIEPQKARLSFVISYVCSTCDCGVAKIKLVYPVVWKWILYFGKLIFLLAMIWLDCNIRGFTSLLRFGMTSFFTVLWCSLLSIIGMVGLIKVILMMVITVLLVVFLGIGPALLALIISATVVLWLYGSFWTTCLVTLLGGVTFGFRHERLALCLTTFYSLHCAKSYMGWLGLLLGLNLSFISCDVFLRVLPKNVNEHRFDIPQGQDIHSETGADVDDTNTSTRHSADFSCEIPSTSGRETELTSEDEVARMLNCRDHYSVLGFNRYDNFDASVLKKEYRKMAMLVHPDKNMGNEKAAEAFKKLQNAYEVLLDSIKRKNYDDELRTEEFLNYIRKFQTSSHKNGRHGVFSPESNHFEAEDGGFDGVSRRILCKKCHSFHVWMLTERSKSHARWCQDCKVFHPAKDGDGWLEQSLHPFFFGLLQKVDSPRAYVCSENRIYDATPWFFCQGMRCPANTHKPSFHVNTSLSSKHNGSSKASSSAHRGSNGMPSAKNGNMRTEEDFFEWFQNAVNSERFGTDGNHKEDPCDNSSGSKNKNNKKTRKGKKQR